MTNLIYNAIRTPDGTILESRSVHDFVGHTDANGKFYAVDGGLEYLKRCGDSDYEELSLTLEDDFSKIRECVRWGTYGPKGNQPMRLVKIKDLSTNHIQNILKGRIGIKIRFVFEKELEFRISLISKINPEFDCLYKDTPSLFKLVTEEEFEEQMKFKQ